MAAIPGPEGILRPEITHTNQLPIGKMFVNASIHVKSSEHGIGVLHVQFKTTEIYWLIYAAEQ